MRNAAQQPSAVSPFGAIESDRKTALIDHMRGLLKEAQDGKIMNVTRMTKEERRQFLTRT